MAARTPVEALMQHVVNPTGKAEVYHLSLGIKRTLGPRGESKDQGG
jgi:hypothetical protein